MKTWLGLVVVSGVVLGAFPARTSWAQAPAGPSLNSIEAIEQEFKRDLVAAERARIVRMAVLASNQPKADAQKTYEELFRFAIGVGLYNEAEPFAQRVLAASDSSPTATMLAHLIKIVAQANRGAYDESLESLTAAVHPGNAKQNADNQAIRTTALPLPAKMQLVNAYIQKLVSAGQFEVAKKALVLIRDNGSDPAVKGLAASRLSQIELIGKPAPAIKGTDFDGKAVSLEAEKGSVVLVVFWASWCLQNSHEVAQFEKALDQFGKKGLKVIGVNVDTLQDGGLPPESVMPNVKRFIVEYNIRWPNVMSGTGANDIAKAYSVTEIPTNVLIGRDGTVTHIDLHRENMADVINKALGSK